MPRVSGVKQRLGLSLVSRFNCGRMRRYTLSCERGTVQCHVVHWVICLQAVGKL